MIKMQHFKTLAVAVLSRLLAVLANGQRHDNSELSRVEVYERLLMSGWDPYHRCTISVPQQGQLPATRWMVISTQYAAAKVLVDHDERYNFTQCP
jgi:hypothetical protein